MRHSVRAIIINKDRLALMHRSKFGREYYTLLGGGIDAGESREQALMREIAEESGLSVANPRLVAVDKDKFYGPQYVYMVDYVSGEPRLALDSDEAKISGLGKNIYQPMWVALADLPKIPFMSPELQKTLLEYLPKGFPEQPIMLD